MSTGGRVSRCIVRSFHISDTVDSRFASAYGTLTCVANFKMKLDSYKY